MMLMSSSRLIATLPLICIPINENKTFGFCLIPDPAPVPKQKCEKIQPGHYRLFKYMACLAAFLVIKYKHDMHENI